MPNHSIPHGRSAWLAVGLVACAFAAAPIAAQDAATPDSADSVTEPAAVDNGVVSLQFAFEGMPWRDVIKWFADAAAVEYLMESD